MKSIREKNMGFVARLLGRKRKDNGEEGGISQLQAAMRERTRRELISMAVRDTLKKHGLSAGSVTADPLPSFTSSRHRGMHVQLVFRDWQPSLLSYVVALESAVKSRLERLDPLSPAWITGMSWRFEPKDRTVWPQLPPSGKSSANPIPVHRVDTTRSDAAFQNLLRTRDDDFMPTARQDLAVVPDFSPTLPMKA